MLSAEFFFQGFGEVNALFVGSKEVWTPLLASLLSSADVVQNKLFF